MHAAEPATWDTNPVQSGGEAQRELTVDTLESLLAFLGPDRRQAAAEYEKLRRRLIRLFEWRGCPFPEELTDRTFDRAARQLRQRRVGARPITFLHGVAFNIFREECRERQREWQAACAALPAPPEPGEQEPKLSALDRCLEELDGLSRELLLDYHAASDDGHMRQRQAGRLGISVNTLRVRAFRLRRSIERCVRQRLEGAA